MVRSMELGVVGKPNVGKSTFFSAATLAPAQIANYPFTTIEPNRGVAFVRVKCPHLEIGKPCNPVHGGCQDGKRFVPVDVLDVAGLVPKAHEGRGLGNKFLDDLRQAAAFIHVVDTSGGTDFEGNPVKPGTHDPLEDVRFLEEELAHWVRGILARDLDKVARRAELEETPMERVLHERLAGLGVTESQIHVALTDAGMDAHPSRWTAEDTFRLSKQILRRGKPMMVAANKADIAPPEAIGRLRKDAGTLVVPTAAEFELSLRRAAKAGLIAYEPGASTFRILDPGKLSPAQLAGLNRIESFLETHGSTGVQPCIEEAVRTVHRRGVLGLQAVLLRGPPVPGPPELPPAGLRGPEGGYRRARGPGTEGPVREGHPPAPLEDAGVPGAGPEARVRGDGGGHPVRASVHLRQGHRRVRPGPRDARDGSVHDGTRRPRGASRTPGGP